MNTTVLSNSEHFLCTEQDLTTFFSIVVIVTSGFAIAPWIIDNIEEEMSEGALLTVLVEGLSNGNHFL